MATAALIPSDEFIGLEHSTHLAVGGEAPMLKSHRQTMERFFADRVLGETTRSHLEGVYQTCKEKTAKLLAVDSEEIAFLSSSSEGINLLAHALTWEAGDNVVVCDVDFPSDILPWTQLEQQGVEVRIVRHQDWLIRLEDIAAALDERTRVVSLSLVSYFTGQRLPLAKLSDLVRSTKALLLVDTSHATGAVSVVAQYADILVSSCYKWLLGVHGTAIFYWNRARLPDLEPPFLGWNNVVAIPSWQDPTSYILPPTADRFVPGNPSFVSLYLLENALDHILDLGISKIEAHVLQLSGQVWQGLQQMGWEVMTPEDPAQRAGNICVMVPDVERVVTGLAERNVLVWGSYGGVERVRISTHLYNSSQDVETLLAAMVELLE